MGDTTSLLGKIKTLFNATLHDIVNKALRGNGIPVLQEYLRQHELALEEIDGSLAVLGGQVKTAQRKVNEAQSLVTDITTEIEKILTDGNPENDYLAEQLAIDLTGQESLMKQHQATFNRQTGTQAQVLEAKKELLLRVSSLKNQIELLKVIKQETEIKKLTADSLIQSANLISRGVSIQDIAETIKQNNDKEDARLELALSRLAPTSQLDEQRQAASTRLDEIRKRLGLSEETSASTPVTEAAVSFDNLRQQA